MFSFITACSDEANENDLVDLHVVANQDVISINIPLELNETTLSINSEFSFTLQGLKSNGIDLVTISNDIEWSLSDGAVSAIDQQGLLQAGAIAEEVTITAKFGIFTESIDIRISAAKFDRVDQLHDSVFSINMCQSQELQPVGRYVDDNGDEEIRAVDSTTLKNINWTILNQEDRSPSKRAYIEFSSDNRTILHTLSAGDIIVQATTPSLIISSDVTVEFDQEVSNNLNTVKLCLADNTDINSCSVTSPSVEQDKALSFVSIANYQAADGSNFYQNITRNSQWGISNISDATIDFTTDRQQLEVTGVTEDTTPDLSVACGAIQQSLDAIDITAGVTLDTTVSCGVACVESSVNIGINKLAVLSFEVTANDILLTDDESVTLTSQPVELDLIVKVNLSNGDLTPITDDEGLSYIIIPIDGQFDSIEDKADSLGVFTVLGAGTAKILLTYRTVSFTVIVEIP